ncbi:MAG: gamma-glutamylcyclotransferase [Pseudomonadota bacterium]
MQRDDTWVFGYGSLMWKPGFDYAERRVARLDGFRRCFGLRSEHYRGTPEFPGLVLGLDWAPGAACHGMAFRIDAEQAEAVRHYLAERELISRAYFEAVYPVEILCDGPGQGTARDALCYIMDRTHPQYAGTLSEHEQVDTICRAIGPSGPNVEYLMNTVERLDAFGLPDDELRALAEAVRAKLAA